MRRLAAAAAAFLLIISLVLPVFAATGATSVQSFATVSSDGTCQITLNATLHLDSVVEDLYFPLPRDARSVTLNGSSARTKRSGDVLLVNLSRLVGNVAGDFSVSINYTLRNLVTINSLGRPELSLPLLSGFSYPVDRLEFTVTLPGAVTTKPVFSSGYYQQSIETNLIYSVSQNKITGVIDKQLKDQETLFMILEVPVEMFPGVIEEQWRSNFDNIAMYVLAVLAVLYWIVFLRCLPPRRTRAAAVPEGYTAGQLGGILANQGADLTMMVFTWAQLGYILIHLDNNNRVVLHKRMEMGNERSGFEQKLFRKLFGKRRMVDGTGYHYAQLCRSAAASRGVSRELNRRGSGNTRVLRILGALIGLFGGISLGNALAGNAILGGLLAVVLAAVCSIAAWLIQDWVRGLHLNGKDRLYIALGCAAVWLLLGVISGDIVIAACVVAGQFLVGLAAAYGGRRTPAGKQLMAQVLGLRRYMRTVEPDRLKRLCAADPDYFFTLAPCALALGSCDRFAKRFGHRRLSGCPYLTTGMDGHMTAAEWCQVMKRAAAALDARQKRLLLERLLSK